MFCRGIDSGIHLLLADRGRKRMGSLRSVWHGDCEIELWRLRRRHRDGKERSGRCWLGKSELCGWRVESDEQLSTHTVLKPFIGLS